jgi:N-acetylglucosaminyldiphosphoundecaprenol N-acetyl-beta-D-mannosaminyltransferase
MALALDTMEILGIPLSAVESYDHAVDYVTERTKGGLRTFCVALTPEKSHKASKDEQLLRSIRSADLHICDGIGMAMAARALCGRAVARVTGVELFQRVVARAAAEGFSVFLLGAGPESNAGACAALQAMYPSLRLAGSQHGYFKDTERVIESINDSGADMLFVAMGSPYQENWIAAHRHRIRALYCMGVGGSFDVLSGSAKRAPRIFRRTGTEFLYRFIHEPRRWKREVCAVAFCVRVFRVKVLG